MTRARIEGAGGNGVTWSIWMDTPGGHCVQRLNLVKGLECLENDDDDDDDDDDDMAQMERVVQPQQEAQQEAQQQQQSLEKWPESPVREEYKLDFGSSDENQLTSWQATKPPPSKSSTSAFHGATRETGLPIPTHSLTRPRPMPALATQHATVRPPPAAQRQESSDTIGTGDDSIQNSEVLPMSNNEWDSEQKYESDYSATSGEDEEEGSIREEELARDRDEEEQESEDDEVETNQTTTTMTIATT